MTHPNHRHDVESILKQFCIDGRFRSAAPYGNGHINDTYCTVFDCGGALIRYILQRINHAVFKNPPALMDNIRRVTEHLRRKQAGRADARRRTLTLIPARDGNVFHRDEDGNSWRVYEFIEGARTHETVESPRHAFEAAKAFGEFQRLLADLPGPRLHESIPDFHHTPKRFEAFERAVEADAVGRADSAGPEIDFARRRRPLASLLLDLHRDRAIPERITHNDTKINNVMLDDATHEGLCVIDLDTVMPGLALYDYADMVRTATSPAPEDECDLSKVRMRMPMYEALVRGYLAGAGDGLHDAERRHLVDAGRLITLEIGVRFLTDYLAGDVYFKTRRAGHNLDRCRTQFKLIESIEEQQTAMEKLADAPRR